MKSGILCCILCCFCSNCLAEITNIDPGADDTSFFYNSYEMPGFPKNAKLDGRMITLDFYFCNDKLVRAQKVEIELVIIQDDKLGVAPRENSLVTGYLINSDSLPLTESILFPNTLTMPAQIWSVPGYILPDGTEYLPAQKGYRMLFTGTRSKPLVFSGIHFDVKTPALFGRKIIGCRLTLSNYLDYNKKTGIWLNPIHISKKIPDHAVPKSSNVTSD
jgi:hypothetical protein